MNPPEQPAALSLRISSTRSQLSEAQDGLERAEAFAALPDKCQYAVRLLLDEIASNVIKYGSGTAGDATIDLDYWEEDENLIIRVRDDGAIFDPGTQPDPDPGRLLDRLQEGGLGLYLIRKTVDELVWRQEDGKNVFLAKMRLGICESATNS